MAAAVTGPTPGSDSRVAGSAVLRLTSAPVSPGVAPRVPATPVGTGHADQDLLAVDERPGQVERGEVDAAPRPTRGVERVHDPRARREHGDAGAADLAGDVDGHVAPPGSRGRRRSDLCQWRRSRGRPPAPAPARPGRGSRPRTRPRRPPRPPPRPRPGAPAELQGTHAEATGRVPAGDGKHDRWRRRPRPVSPRMLGVLLVGWRRRLLPSYGGELGTQRRQASRHGLGVLGRGLVSTHASTLGIGAPSP